MKAIDRQWHDNFTPFSVKGANPFSGKTGPLVLLDGSEKLKGQRKLYSVNHARYKFNTKTLWIKTTRGSGIIVTPFKTPGAKKYTFPSKSIVILSKSDLGKFNNKYPPVLSYTPSSKTFWCSMFRVHKQDQLHIDTPSAKIMAFCNIGGIKRISKGYMKAHKQLALANYKWLKKIDITKVECIYNTHFAELLCYMGLLIP
jgi:hypothetical protein